MFVGPGIWFSIVSPSSDRYPGREFWSQTPTMKTTRISRNAIKKLQ